MKSLVSPFSRRGSPWAPVQRIITLLTVIVMISVAMQGQSSTTFADDGEQAIYEPYINTGWGPNAGSITLQQSVVHSGRYAYQVTPGSSGYRPVTMGFSPIDLTCWIYIPATFSLSSGSNSGVICGLLSTSSWVTSGVGVANFNSAFYLAPTGLPQGTHPVSTNTWHLVEFSYGSTATVWLDGVQDSTGSITTEAKNNVLIGMLNNSGVGNIYVDDLAVSGTKSSNPTAGLTVRHAYPGNRLAMKIQSYLFGASSTDQLVSSVDGNVFSTISNPGTYQEPVLTLTSLAAGSHTLQVQLLSSSGATRATWTERFTASGLTPLVGIDANNNLVKGGHKVFPITPWMTNVILWYNAGYINASGWASGWAGTYSPSQYQNFMENSDPNIGLNCLSNGMPVIGPAASRMGGAGSDAANYALYASTLTNHPCILLWSGYDEASVNGISISTMQGSMNAVHTNDNNHPFVYDDATFPILHLEWYYPTLVADVYSSDNYPLCYAIGFHSQRKQMSDWVDEMDRETRANYGLVPDLQVLELYKFVGGNFDCTSNNSVTGTAVSAATVYNEAWMTVIHGRKGVSWYDNGVNTYTQCSSDAAGNCFPANPQNHIGKFTHDIATITPDVVLAAPTGRTVISNQTTKCNPSGPVLGTRVDATVREDSNNVWVFAARLTDPLCTPTENSAAALNTQLTVSGLGSMTATVLNENRQVAVTNGVISDSFAPWAVHIYQIPKGATGSPAPQPPPPQPTPPTMNPPVVN